MSLRVSKVLVVVLGFAFAVEGALYSAVTPIMPLLSRRLGMSESQAGVMLSSYSAALVVGSLLCALALRRLNARGVATGALTLLALSTVVFAWSQDYELSVSFRLVQGLAGGAIWTASITWLLRLFPSDQRGEALGLSVGPAVVGTIAGPAIGTVALELGVRGPYTVVAVLCLAAAGWLLRMPKPPLHGDVEKFVPTARGRSRRLAVLGAAVATVAGALLGLINLMGPLVLVGLGAAERIAGLVFVIAAVATVIAARPLGMLVDRRGTTWTASAGLIVMALALPVFGMRPGVLLTGAVVVILLLANNLCYISAGALMTREGEKAGWTLSFVTALTATVWGVGETAGALLAGVGLDYADESWTAWLGGALAAVMLLGVLIVGAERRQPGVIVAPENRRGVDID
jgi:predicted MFS family arabinose efflux permease